MPNPDMKFSLQPPWKFFLARLFGKKIEQINEYDQTLLVGYQWRGQMYISKIELLREMKDKPNDDVSSRVVRGAFPSVHKRRTPDGGS